MELRIVDITFESMVKAVQKHIGNKIIGTDLHPRALEYLEVFKNNPNGDLSIELEDWLFGTEEGASFRSAIIYKPETIFEIAAPERFPTPEDVIAFIGTITKGKECKENKDRRGKDDKGVIYFMEFQVSGESKGEMDEYEYVKKGTTPNGKIYSKTEISVAYYIDGEPRGGQNVAKYVDGSWEIYPDADIAYWKNYALNDLRKSFPVEKFDTIRKLDPASKDFSDITAQAKLFGIPTITSEEDLMALKTIMYPNEV